MSDELGARVLDTLCDALRATLEANERTEMVAFVLGRTSAIVDRDAMLVWLNHVLRRDPEKPPSASSLVLLETERIALRALPLGHGERDQSTPRSVEQFAMLLLACALRRHHEERWVLQGREYDLWFELIDAAASAAPELRQVVLASAVLYFAVAAEPSDDPCPALMQAYGSTRLVSGVMTWLEHLLRAWGCPQGVCNRECLAAWLPAKVYPLTDLRSHPWHRMIAAIVDVIHDASE